MPSVVSAIVQPVSEPASAADIAPGIRSARNAGEDASLAGSVTLDPSVANAASRRPW
jgi:hypothetical protein